MNVRDGSRRTSGPHEDWDGRAFRRIVADWYGIQRSRGEQFLLVSFELFFQLMSRSPLGLCDFTSRKLSYWFWPHSVVTMGPRIGVSLHVNPCWAGWRRRRRDFELTGCVVLWGWAASSVVWLMFSSTVGCVRAASRSGGDVAWSARWASLVGRCRSWTADSNIAVCQPCSVKV